MGHLALAHAALHLLDGFVFVLFHPGLHDIVGGVRVLATARSARLRPYRLATQCGRVRQHLVLYHFGYNREMGGPPSLKPLHWVASSKRGSATPKADLGYADSEAMLIKARLITEIAEIIRNRGLTQGQAAAILGLTQPKVSSLLKGRFRGISERRLLNCLTRLGSSPTIHNPRSTIQSYARMA